LVELALIVPVLLLILTATIEFGFVFTHNLTLEYATREAARTGAALYNGGGALGCGAGQSPNWTDVDPLIIAAAERVLASPGSHVASARVSQIVIYRVDGAGNPIAGTSNVWNYSAGAGPVPQGTTEALNYVDAQYSGNPASNNDAWKACARINTLPNPDALGVRLVYTYNFQTPLAAILGFFGGDGATTLTMTDRTVMHLNPSTT
jgi:hypothetical protein